MKDFRVYFGLFIVAVIAISIALGTKTIEYGENGISQVLLLLGTLLFISLLLERFLDVFLTTWRAPKSERRSLRIVELKEEIAQSRKDGKPVEALTTELHKEEKDILSFKAHTRTVALWLSFTVGILLSCAGVRTISVLLGGEAIASAQFQHKMFTVLDIILTGGLIAGGSDGIHKITDVMRVFMESTARKAGT
jgi:hypothetical protein